VSETGNGQTVGPAPNWMVCVIEAIAGRGGMGVVYGPGNGAPNGRRVKVIAASSSRTTAFRAPLPGPVDDAIPPRPAMASITKPSSSVPGPTVCPFPVSLTVCKPYAATRRSVTTNRRTVGRPALVASWSMREVSRRIAQLACTYGASPYAHRMATPARSRRIEIRVTEEEHAAEDSAARTLGVSLSEFYRQAARERAEEIPAERSRIVLDRTPRFGSSMRLISPSASSSDFTGWLTVPQC